MDILVPLAAGFLGTGVLASTAPASAPNASVTLSLVGDIRLDGAVGRLIAAHGPLYPVSELRAPLSADLALGNLECAVTTRGEKLPKTFNFRAPPKNLAALKEAGFQILNLANNHVMDYGAVGFQDTLTAVKKGGFLPIGGGRNLSEAETPLLVEKNGLIIGFLGFTSTFPKEAWAKANRPGVAYSDFNRFPAIIQGAKKRCDVLVVSFHGGTELAAQPNQIQKDFGRLAVESGADLVVGHHPHVLQAVEIYKNKPILHSLGNFLFVSPSPQTRATVIAKAVLSKVGVERIDFIPMDTGNGRPVPADGELAASALAALDSLGALSLEPEKFRLKPITAHPPSRIEAPAEIR